MRVRSPEEFQTYSQDLTSCQAAVARPAILPAPLVLLHCHLEPSATKLDAPEGRHTRSQ
jgi:hypothetical protein